MTIKFLQIFHFPVDQFDAVGDRYGLFVYKKLMKNHVIISEFGSYEGKTIIINSKGQELIT